MQTYNMPHRIKARREKVLAYWKAQLDPKTRSPECDSDAEYIKSQIKALEAKLGGAS